MTVQVTFAGVSYDVPEEDDSGWADLTSYLVALSAASVGTTDSKSARVATSTPITVSSTDDYAVGVNVASASTVTLPSGTTGQIIVVFDASGEAANNNITIQGTGGQTINGLLTHVINSNYGAAVFQYVVSGWVILSEKKVTTENNQTNLSIIDASIAADNTGVTVDDGESCTVTFLDSAAIFEISFGTNSLVCACSRGSNIVNCLSDPNSSFLTADAGTGIYVSKATDVITIKSRLGSSVLFKIKFVVGQVASATAWS
jgi:hypothetical protein